MFCIRLCELRFFAELVKILIVLPIKHALMAKTKVFMSILRFLFVFESSKDLFYNQGLSASDNPPLRLHIWKTLCCKNSSFAFA